MDRHAWHNLTKGMSARKHLPEVMTLIRASMAPGSGATYRTALQACGPFRLRNNFPLVFPLDQAMSALYVGYLHDQGYATSRKATHLSAIIGFVRKLLGFEDPSGCFLIQKILQGPKTLHPSHETRLTAHYFPSLDKAAWSTQLSMCVSLSGASVCFAVRSYWRFLLSCVSGK